jgi:predicted transcriptional regulator
VFESRSSIVESLNILQTLSNKISHGRPPKFTQAYILKALQIINEHHPGRKQLSIKLGLGEGTIRTLIRRFQEENLVKTSRHGMSLTEKGWNVLSSILQVLTGSKFPKTKITVADHNFAVHVKRGSHKVRYGVEQRDDAIMVGAKGASTLVMKDNTLIMPGIESGVDADSIDALKTFELENEDVVIIGSAESILLAEIGAYSAALELIAS